MNKFHSWFIAAALVVIAVNMSITNLKPVPQPRNEGEERVVQVIGRVSALFDGFGADVGFLVKDGNELRVVRYDQGSMASNEAYQPAYLKVLKFPDGKIVMGYSQIAVDPIR